MSEAAENFLSRTRWISLPRLMGTTIVAHLNHIVPMCVVTISLVGYHGRRHLRGEIS